ncbi:MAG: hypothetical protein IJA87_07325 [Clostridia bacterium]|nr:hypothetical protein [Clostridia bacterium]
MSKFEELLQNYVNKDYAELMFIAKAALDSLLPDCYIFNPRENGDKTVALWIVIAALGADSKLSPLERKFICELLSIDNSSLDTAIKAYTPRMADITDVFADKEGEHVKEKVLTLVLCIAACDEKIAHEETAFIRRILA